MVSWIVQWWETVRERFAHITTLVINLDNGPENHSRHDVGGWVTRTRVLWGELVEGVGQLAMRDACHHG